MKRQARRDRKTHSVFFGIAGVQVANHPGSIQGGHFDASDRARRV
jgi:hypothetical protein